MSGWPFSTMDVMVGTVSPVVMSALQPKPLFMMNLSTFASTSADCQFMLAMVTSPHPAAEAASAQPRKPTAAQAVNNNDLIETPPKSAVIHKPVPAVPRTAG